MTQSSWGFDTVNDPAGDATNPVTDAQLADFFHNWLAGGTNNAGVLAGVGDALAADIPLGTNSRIRVGTGRALVHGYPYINTSDVVLVTGGVGQDTRRRVVLQLSVDSGDANYKETRLVILNGTIGTLSEPALTQDGNAIWQVPICAFTVGSGGAISDLVDERVLVGPNTPLFIPAGSIGSTEIASNAIERRHYSDGSIPSDALPDGIIDTDKVSDDIVRRHDSSTWNTVRDVSEAAYNALTPDSDTFYTVDE